MAIFSRKMSLLGAPLKSQITNAPSACCCEEEEIDPGKYYCSRFRVWDRDNGGCVGAIKSVQYTCELGSTILNPLNPKHKYLDRCFQFVPSSDYGHYDIIGGPYETGADCVNAGCP